MEPEAFQGALTRLTRELPIDRAVIVFGPGSEPPVVAAHRLPEENFWTSAPLSLSLLKTTLRSGEPVLVGDIRQAVAYQDHFSLILSDVRSLVCLPLWDATQRVAGLIYADSVGQFGALNRSHLGQALLIARQLEARLDPNCRPGPPRPAPRLVTRTPSFESRLPTRLKPPNLASMVAFLRSLATLFGAGIPLHQGLALLGDQGEDARMAAVAMELARRVHRGQCLSEAMRDTGVFGAFQIHMVEAGLRSGSLHRILVALANQAESQRRQLLSTAATLVYPGVLLLVCLILLVVTPAMMLRGQLDLLREMGVSVPWLTRVLLEISGWFRSAWLWLGVSLVLGLGLRHLKRVDWSAWAGSTPVLGEVWRILSRARFARALAVQLEAGLQVGPSLGVAAAVAGMPALRIAEARLTEGATLRDSLAATHCFSRSFLEMVAVGEESGRLPVLLAWLADRSDEDLDYRLSSLTAALEPLVLLIMGLVTTLMCLATMLPMVAALRSL